MTAEEVVAVKWRACISDAARTGHILAISLLTTVICAACSVGPSYPRPEPVTYVRLPSAPTSLTHAPPATPAVARPTGPAEIGVASWYGPNFHGRKTASGERFDQHSLTAAHRTLPFGTYVDITNLQTGKRIRVRVNDRGPHVKNRIIDVSRAAAVALDMTRSGVARVELRLADPSRVAQQPAPGYVVQVGGFKYRSRAERVAAETAEGALVRDQLADGGRCYVKDPEDASGSYLVRCGPIADQSEAKALAANLRQQGMDAMSVREAPRVIAAMTAYAPELASNQPPAQQPPASVVVTGAQAASVQAR